MTPHQSSVQCVVSRLCFCLLQWQYSPDNTGVAKRRRASKAARAAAEAAAAKEPVCAVDKPILTRATSLPANSQASGAALSEAQGTLSGHILTTSTGTSIGRSEAGKESATDTSPDESSAHLPAKKQKALVTDNQQLPSQLPAPLPAAQPTASVATPTEPQHVSDHIRTCRHAAEVPPKPSSSTTLPAQLEFSHEESPQRSKQLSIWDPAAAAPTSDLPSEILAAKGHVATPIQNVATPIQTVMAPLHNMQSGAENVLERTPSDSAQTPHTQGLLEDVCKAAAVSTAAQVSMPVPGTQVHRERATQERSPEPRGAAEGSEAVVDPGLTLGAFSLFAKSRSRSQSRHFSVPNPFRVSPEALHRPPLPSTQPPNAAQNPSQTPVLNCPARAASRSMSPEALHVLQLGSAGHELPIMHRSKSPEMHLLSAPKLFRQPLPQLTAAVPSAVEGSISKATTVLADNERKDTGSSSGDSEEVCSDSERRASRKRLSRSTSPASESDIMVVHNKLAKLRAQHTDESLTAHQHSADVPGHDGQRRVSNVEAQP